MEKREIVAVLLIFSALLSIPAMVQASIPRMSAAESTADLQEELAYDDGESDGSWSLGGMGHAVRFTPPTESWTIIEVKVYGERYGEDKQFDIEIWDENLNTLYEASYMYSEYFATEIPVWAEIEVSNVEVTGDFYVCLFMDTRREYGVSIGYDGDPPCDGRSYIAYKPNRVDKATLDGWSPDENDWMIRAVGLAPFDFSMSPTPTSGEVTPGETTSFGIEVGLLTEKSTFIDLSVSGIPEGASYTLEPDSGEPPFTSTLTITTTTDVTVGTYTLTITGTGAGVTHEVTVELVVKAKMCIIATATFGSELAPEVQFLREFRDNLVLSTFAGTQFMKIFNAWYYSFSPGVAGFIADQPVARAVTKIVLYPLIGILHLSAVTFSVFAFNHEIGVVMAGLVASSLIGVVYLSPLVLMLLAAVKRLRKSVPRIGQLKLLMVPWLMSIALMLLGEIGVSPITMMTATAAFVLTTLISSAAITAIRVMQHLS